MVARALLQESGGDDSAVEYFNALSALDIAMYAGEVEPPMRVIELDPAQRYATDDILASQIVPHLS